MTFVTRSIATHHTLHVSTRSSSSMKTNEHWCEREESRGGTRPGLPIHPWYPSGSESKRKTKGRRPRRAKNCSGGRRRREEVLSNCFWGFEKGGPICRVRDARVQSPVQRGSDSDGSNRCSPIHYASRSRVKEHPAVQGMGPCLPASPIHALSRLSEDLSNRGTPSPEPAGDAASLPRGSRITNTAPSRLRRRCP